MGCMNHKEIICSPLFFSDRFELIKNIKPKLNITFQLPEFLSDGWPKSLYDYNKDGSMITANYLRHDETDVGNILANDWFVANEGKHNAQY